jgi:undecaprenyl phosphate N,N'-diacetylbacillosamine 1-phosphate transferase
LYSRYLKFAIDKIVALLALVVAFPFLLLAALVLRLSNSGSPWFFQVRPGKDGRLFTVIKFRTMNERRNDRGELLPDAERLTPAGRFIRKTSLDEFPQLWNVLKGDMSIVGPRPLLVEYLPLYNDHQRRRMAVRPGITGWAQVNGRNAISWQQRFEYDVWYVNHLSFWLDLKILFLTVIKVIQSEGISSGSSATMEKFRGNHENPSPP